nr:MAG TPA: hypothetical protein [Microviridae sp.]
MLTNLVVLKNYSYLCTMKKEVIKIIIKVALYVHSVNKFGSFKKLFLSLHHEKGSYQNYHQSSIVCTWFDSCIFWCLNHDIMQYVSQCSC